MKTAEFYLHEDGSWRPMNKAATAYTAIISKRFIRDEQDFLRARIEGYVPVDVETGKELGRVDVRV